jgi:hypothetical protein
MVVTSPHTAITRGLFEICGKPGPGSRFGLEVSRTAITASKMSFQPFSETTTKRLFSSRPTSTHQT